MKLFCPFGSATRRLVPDEYGSVYGLSWNESTDAYTRTGSLSGVATGSSPGNDYLPVQRRMQRCTLLDSGIVNYYLLPTDSTKKWDGTPAHLDGTDGQVMVEIPKFWYRYAYSAPVHVWEISLRPQPGFQPHPAFFKDGAWVDHRYIGAYEGVLYDVSAGRYTNGIYQTAFSCTFAAADKSITANARTAPLAKLAVGDKLEISGTASNNATVTVASLVSDTKITVAEAVIDETAAGTTIQTQKDWTATTGDKLSSVAGFSPIVMGTRAQFREAAVNRGAGWRQLDYDLHSAIQLLYLVEYGSFYAQSTIGAGIVNVNGWVAYNDRNPIAKTGNSNNAGNATGNTAGSSSAATEATKYMSYRGIENLYGHLWKWVDGININEHVPYITNNAAVWADSTATGYTALGITLPGSDGYQNLLQQISRGFLPASVGVWSSTKITDCYYQDTGWRVVNVSGSADNGASAGPFCVQASSDSGVMHQRFSGRVCY
ncbi:MAG: hypothetical protein PHQ43_15855 [Dehalococcoidales bacterium]|nr:hypothetical protein [Dehalococcoidales bacterium]